MNIENLCIPTFETPQSVGITTAFHASPRCPQPPSCRWTAQGWSSARGVSGMKDCDELSPYRDNGKENGNYCSVLGLYGDNGK